MLPRLHLRLQDADRLPVLRQRRPHLLLLPSRLLVHLLHHAHPLFLRVLRRPERPMPMLRLYPYSAMRHQVVSQVCSRLNERKPKQAQSILRMTARRLHLDLVQAQEVVVHRQHPSRNL